MKGHASLQMIIGAGVTGIAMLGGVFAWTYAQFSSVTAHASQTDVTVSAVQQKTTDIDMRLSRIEDKIDIINSHFQTR